MKHRALQIVLSIGISFAGVSACSAQQSQALPVVPPLPPPANPLVMTIPGFSDGGRILDKYTCLGAPAVSPEIHWKQVPAGTQSFVLLFHDLEPHPMKAIQDNSHWVLWNIPGTATGLPENVPAGAKLPDGTHQMQRQRTIQGSFYSYYGPCAGPGPNHHYAWELWALDTKLDLPDTATRAEIIKAADGHILEASGYFGYFHR